MALVGQPNVGKSALFQLLTGRHVTVANYPGTTVEVTRATADFDSDTVVVDTPGVLTLPARTEDEKVTAQLLLDGSVRALVQVGDAKNLRRTLLLAVQLAELGLPMVLALNMADESEAWGMEIDHRRLAEHLALSVVPTVATRGLGVDDLVSAVRDAATPQFRLAYPPPIEAAVAAIGARLTDDEISTRAIALLWLAGDAAAEAWVRTRVEEETQAELAEQRHDLQLGFAEPLSTVLQNARLGYVELVAASVIRDRHAAPRRWRGRVGDLAAHPLWGLLILAVVLAALYLFVGVLGAGTLVDLLEARLFGEVINPWVSDWVSRLVPVQLVADALVGEYGLWTMGMTYALALILPIVTTFFIAFGILEDSGYLPRLAVLTNRVFRMMGLNGRAVVPMVLGLGCVTMATLTTRTLESKRERLLVVLLLALAVPCSAQLGVVMGMLAAISPAATAIWVAVVVGVLLAVGALAARLVPGTRSTLLTELPPLRRPMLSAIVSKTLARLEWYLKEVVPLFLLGSAILFVLDVTGALDRLIGWSEPLVVGWLGLPAAAATAFVLGFLRRDFGAAGFFAMASVGALTGSQVLVAMVTITLFVPCVASVLMIARERGVRTATGITALVFPLAFLIGGLLSRALALLGWGA